MSPDPSRRAAGPVLDVPDLAVEDLAPGLEVPAHLPEGSAPVVALLAAFVAGWNAGDGAACARPFAADADFTAIHGLRARGREQIARGHAEILATIYRGTALCARVDAVRFLRPDVATLDATGRLTGGSRTDWPVTRPGMIATREAEGWVIQGFRNMVPYGRPAAGPVERAALALDGRPLE